MNMDLWATSNNQQESGEPVGQGQQGQGYPRRLTEQVVVSVLRNWLLHDYAAAYCRSLATIRIFRRCYWLDALGIDARAKKDEEVTAANGRRASPLHPVLEPVVALSGTLTQESKPITLRGLVLKAGSSKLKELREPTSALLPAMVLPKESGVIDASWLKAAATILQAIEQSPAIFLLNPFGQTLFAFDDLAPLYQRTGPTELCLLLPHRQLGNHLLAASHTPGTASILTTLLRTDRWKALLVDSMSEVEKGISQQAIDGLIDLFVASMKQRFLTAQRVALPMQVRPAVIENAPYTLVFATRRQDSATAMNDAVCAYARRVSINSYLGVLGEEWFLQQRQERRIEEQRQLHQLILTHGQAQRPRRWPELRQYLLLAHFGRWPIAEYDETLRQLLVSGAVCCQWRRPASEGDLARTPGDEDTLIWKT